MTDFSQTMRDWQRMCKYFDEHYNEDCCHICPIQNCGAIWEMGDITNWEEFEEIISTWAAEHPEPKYPTWREYLKAIGLTSERKVAHYTDPYTGTGGITTYDYLNEKADEPIPPEIAEKFGLKPQY